MAYNEFHGMAQEQLETALALAQQSALSGSSVVSTTSGDVSVALQPDVKTATRIKKILRALSLLDPEKYPPEDCIPVTQTRATFQGCGRGSY
jgi:hypothetical protein